MWKGFVSQGSGLSEWHGGECAEIARMNLEAPHILSDTSAFKGLEFIGFRVITTLSIGSFPHPVTVLKGGLIKGLL